MADNMTTNIDGTDFYLGDGYVGEVGTDRRWSPEHPRGYMMHSRDGWHSERIAVTSFAGFGEDMYRARELADHWCERARKAWDELH